MRSVFSCMVGPLAVLVLGALISGCGGGGLFSPDAKPPEYEPKEGRCTAGKSQSRPLIVEWPASERAALEARTKRGVVPVRYVGCDMEVLTRCELPGSSYEYTGITPKTEHILIRDADELYANIPVYAAKFEGTLQQAGVLNVRTTIVGRFDSPKTTVRSDELKGECERATHAVTALTVGAFEFFAGAEAEAGAGMELLGVGMGGKSSSKRETLNRDGDYAQCSKATGTDRDPPFGCGAILRIEVVPLGEPRKDQPECPKGTAWDGKQCVALASKAAAPGPAAPPPPPSCRAGDVAGCTAECDKGDQPSCVVLGTMYREGSGVTKDGAKAYSLLDAACTAGQLRGCVIAGEIAFKAEGVPKDAANAVALFTKACDGGEPSGCVDLGWAHLAGQGTAKDPTAAAAAFGKACNDQSALGCVGLGMMHRDGQGVARDPQRARELFNRACGAGVAVGCKLKSSVP